MGTWIIGAFVLGIVALATRKVYKDAEKDRRCGCAGCSGCAKSPADN